jgi:hypothetical protein
MSAAMTLLVALNLSKHARTKLPVPQLGSIIEAGFRPRCKSSSHIARAKGGGV